MNAETNRRRRLPVLVTIVTVLVASCAQGVPEPAALDAANTSCRFCRMVVSDVRFAAQLVAPGAEPEFFDDIGCLRNHVSKASIPEDAMAYVADHRTGEWAPAVSAIYSRITSGSTPMGGGVIAHRDAASREADPAAAGGQLVTAAELFGPSGPPNGGR